MDIFIMQVYIIYHKRRKYVAYLYSNYHTRSAPIVWQDANTESVFPKPLLTEHHKYSNLSTLIL